MSENANITFSFSGLPGGSDYCFTTPSRFALDIVSNMTGYLPGQFSVIINSETEPSAEDRSKLWHLQYPGGAPSGRLYSFYLGEWVTPHPVPASSESRIWWTGSESDLWSYDGGDGTDPSSSTPTATTGAMWQRDEDYDGRFPLQAGTLAPSGDTVSPGDTGGEDEHTLTQAETPLRSHSHEDGTPCPSNIPSGGLDYNWFGLGAGSASKNTWQSGAATSYKALTSTESLDATDPTPILPPYKAGMWAKRTARIYFVA